MTKVGIYGATGRVGRLLVDHLAKHENAVLHAVMFKGEACVFPEGVLVVTSCQELLASCDIIIDFTIPEATQELLEAALVTPKPLVIGTTGLDGHQKNLLAEVAQMAPVLYATNMSLGVALLSKLVEIASRSLPGFDIEIVEMHHRFKKDAPSGTALTLAQSAAKGRDLDLDAVRVSGRNGLIGERSKDEIAVMALRGGDIVGRHTVGFYNDGEFIELGHTATSRETFSQGALRAAMWLVDKEAGLYSISDCLGID